ncbi:MAG TPA: hypothetical protein VGO89_17780, partial [Streptomyces sp.]|nr:hypothetical protein [Streptomyces sp.]
MPQVRVLSKGGRITGGIFCLLLTLHTWIWVVRDVVELEIGSTWDLWTGALGQGAGSLTTMPATTSADLGLGLLQLAAVFAAFTGAWAAGGLMAATAVLTFAYRLPVIWHVVRHTESSPYYAMRGFFDDPALDTAAITSGFALIFCAVVLVALLAGLRTWPFPPRPTAPGPPGWPGQPQPYGAPAMPPVPPQPEPPLPSESPQRPTGAHVTLAALFFGVLVLFNIGWNFQAIYAADTQFWIHLFTGDGVVVSMLAVAPAWGWVTMAFTCTIATVLALTRGLSARGFGLGLAIAVLPSAFTTLVGYIDAGVLFELGKSPILSFLSRAQLVMTLVGAVTLVVLTLRPGVPAQPGAGPAPFAPSPSFVPQQQPQPYYPQQQPGPAGP